MADKPLPELKKFKLSEKPKVVFLQPEVEWSNACSDPLFESELDKATFKGHDWFSQITVQSALTKYQSEAIVKAFATYEEEESAEFATGGPITTKLIPYSIGTGAAKPGISGSHFDKMLIELERKFPILGRVMPCPVKGLSCQHVHGAVRNLVQHLNDQHEWSREKIADWVDGLETGN